MTILVFDIETIPDIDLAQKLYNLQDLSLLTQQKQYQPCVALKWDMNFYSSHAKNHCHFISHEHP